MFIIDSIRRNAKLKILQKYLVNLSVMTNVISGNFQTNSKDLGAIMIFDKSCGGGEVRFKTRKEMIDFCNALGTWAKLAKK